MIAYEEDNDALPNWTPKFIRKCIGYIGLGRFFTVSAETVIAPIEAELVIGYVLITLIPLTAYVAKVCPQIRWHAMMSFFTLAACTLHVQYLLRKINPLSPWPMLMTLIPASVLTFLSREVHIITCVFFIMMTYLIYLQVNQHPAFFFIYTLLFIVTYFGTVLGMKYFYVDETTLVPYLGHVLHTPIDLKRELIVCLAVLFTLTFVNQLHRYIIWFGVYHKAKEDMLKAGITTMQKERHARQLKMFVTPLERVQTHFANIARSDAIPPHIQSEIRAIQKNLRSATLYGNKAKVTVNEAQPDLKSFVLSALGQTEDDITTPNGSAANLPSTGDFPRPLSGGSSSTTSNSAFDFSRTDSAASAQNDIDTRDSGALLLLRGMPIGPAVAGVPEVKRLCDFSGVGRSTPPRHRAPLMAQTSSLGRHMDRICEALQPLMPSVRFDDQDPLQDRVTWLDETLQDYNCDVFEIDTAFNGHSMVAIAAVIFGARDLYRYLKITPLELVTNLLEVEKAYNDTPYHNSLHAGDVLATMHWLVSSLSPAYRAEMSEPEVVAVLLAAILHDIGHPGGDNRLQVQLQTPLAQLYNDESVLEHYHASFGWMMVRVDGCDLLSHLPPAAVKKVRADVIQLVLATDMARHVEFLGRLRSSADDENPTTGGLEEAFDPTDDGQRMFWLQCLFKIADISNPTKRWPLARHWALCMMREFFEHGDLERAMGIPISDLKDRTAANPAKSQIGFLQYVIMPLVTALAAKAEHLRPLVAASEFNLAQWTDLVADPDSTGQIMAEIDAISGNSGG